MDEQRFDAVTKAFGMSKTRRGVLLGLFAGVTMGEVEVAETAARKKRQQKQRNKQRKQRDGVRTEQAQKVALCHRTSSDTNELVYIEVSENAVSQHLSHHGDIFDLDTNPEHCGRCGNRCAVGAVCVDGTCCTPTTCADQGKTCGTINDGCGGTPSCGNCPAGSDCVGGTCASTCRPFGASCSCAPLFITCPRLPGGGGVTGPACCPKFGEQNGLCCITNPSDPTSGVCCSTNQFCRQDGMGGFRCA